MSIELVLRNIKKIESALKYKFKNKDLLVLALTHCSFVNENKTEVSTHNERLEFLGDAILGLIVSEYLYETLPSSKEGELSHLRSSIVDASSCFNFVQKLAIEDFVLMGKGEQKNLGKGRDSIFADLFEALLGAIYLDGGMKKTKKFFFGHFSDELEVLMKQPGSNWKAHLQDYYQKKYQKQPTYRVMSEEGPDHEKTFYVSAFIDDERLGSGRGDSKKEAEQQAAKDAYERLLNEKPSQEESDSGETNDKD